MKKQRLHYREGVIDDKKAVAGIVAQKTSLSHTVFGLEISHENDYLPRSSINL
jgi:hypothetical protein